nr:hypothetical protein BaRGS_020694 [Batillaria attramentaria]
MKTSTAQKRNGIQWTLWTQLDDLDFADDLALLSHTQQQMQEKTNMIADTSARLGLNIHKGKTKVLKVNAAANTGPIILEGEALEEVENFTYLGSIVDKQGGTDADVRIRTGKARSAFLQLKNVWSSADLSTSLKIRIFNTIVKPVLLYGAETWRTTRYFPLKDSVLQRVSKIDGVNQWDMLSTGGDSKREEFVYNIDTILNSTAIRYKDYKLMTGSPGTFNDWYPLPKDEVAMPSTEYYDDGQLADVVSKQKWNPRLYNIRLDPEERNDLSETEPDMMTFMMNRLQQWMKSGVPPQNSPKDPKGDPKNWDGVWTPGWC